ncbi:hypothetical protein KC324_g36 [Hortaea werneckii]|nr:hypothetical protein KC324_g36 [Hortaea werneckii]
MLATFAEVVALCAPRGRLARPLSQRSWTWTSPQKVLPAPTLRPAPRSSVERASSGTWWERLLPGPLPGP